MDTKTLTDYKLETQNTDSDIRRYIHVSIYNNIQHTQANAYTNAFEHKCLIQRWAHNAIILFGKDTQHT